MGSYPTNRFVPYTYKRECARCGSDFLRNELRREERTNLLVCSQCYDPPHPQDTAVRNRRERPIRIDGGGKPTNVEIDTDSIFTSPALILQTGGDLLLNDDGSLKLNE